jgi:hypothetical protein
MADRARNLARTWALPLVVLLLAGSALAWLAHPVCVPLSEADVESFNRWQPIEQRRDRQLHGPVFQLRAGQWYQCKSWISRQFFF